MTSMHRVVTFALGNLLCASLAFAETGTSSEARLAIHLASGNQKVLIQDQPIRRIAIGDPAIADARVISPRELLILGKRPGDTSLFIWDKGKEKPRSYRIQIGRSARLAEAALSSRPNQQLRAVPAGANLILDGQSTDVQKHAQAIQTLNGNLPSEAGGKTGGTAPAVVDQATIPISNQVQVDIKLVEMSRRVLKQAGINLLSNTAGFTIGTFAPSTLSSAVMRRNPSGIETESMLPISQAFNLIAGASSNGVLGILSLLEANSMARTLAEPSLVAMTGQSASFLAGGEFPIPVPQTLGQVTVMFKQYGVRLTLTPTVISESKIVLKVSPEVSDLDFNSAIKLNGFSVPGLLTRRADTTIEIGNGETFVLGGLVSRNTLENVDKVPFLGDLPILGAFFKSVKFDKEDRELLIIATPHLVRPMAADARLPALPGEQYANRNPGLLESMAFERGDFETHAFGLSK